LGLSALVHNNFDARLPVIERAEGVWLYDADGKDYIDGSSGAVVTLVGHNHPRVLSAMAGQASRVTFTHRGAFTSEPAERLADELAALTGYPGVWLVNSGSEAMEAALQFALQYHCETGRSLRQLFLSHQRGYHGNTLGALSLSGHGRRRVVERIAAPWPTLPTPSRSAAVGEEQTLTSDLLAGVRAELQRTAGTVAGIVVEVVGGATLGAVLPPDGYLQGLRELCEEFDTLLIFDEVMTGLARTGRTLAAEHWGVRADIQVVGKGLGGGYTPIAATLLSAPIVEAIATGSRRVLGGHTYAGNPMSAAIARAVLTVVADERLTERAATQGERLGKMLEELASRHDSVAEVRGIGMLWGVELRNPHGPTGAAAATLTAQAADAGLIVYQATGGFNDAVLVAPPLTISELELGELGTRFDIALSAMEGAQ
jgi:adenosylmethionine-8-amino-7-oxononanoate aminotransferase